jgi:hypothetical protein
MNPKFKSPNQCISFNWFDVCYDASDSILESSVYFSTFRKSMYVHNLQVL